MKLKEGSILFVRIDYKNNEEEISEQDGMDSMMYLQNLAKERYLVAGVFGNIEFDEIDGAMIIYEAKDLEEAKILADKDPIIERGYYRYELHKWNVMLASE